MKLQSVESPDSRHFAEFWELYESAFPADERRDMQAQRGLFGRPGYRLAAFAPGGAFAGFISSWDLGQFVFIEHFAVKGELRGKGTGTAMLTEFLAACGKPVVIEVEPPGTPMQKRRIAFYSKLSFMLNPFDYVQPPYGPAKKAVRLLLMSYPRALSGEEFTLVRSRLHTVVYGLEGPLV